MECQLRDEPFEVSSMYKLSNTWNETELVASDNCEVGKSHDQSL